MRSVGQNRTIKLLPKHPIIPPTKSPLRKKSVSSLISRIAKTPFPFHVYTYMSPNTNPPHTCPQTLPFSSTSLTPLLSLSLSLPLSTMADRNHSQQRAPRHTTNPTTASFLSKLQANAPNSTQLLGFLTLFISATILLILTGLTITATILGIIFFTPLIIISSPIWVPIGTVLFIAIAGFLSVCGFGVTVVAGLSWIYRYFKGMNPPGSDQVDYARSRIYDTASHVKDYAREYGGYLQSKVKDAAPGA